MPVLKIFFVLIVLINSTAHAAEISIFSSADNDATKSHVIFNIDGDIVAGDSDKLARLVIREKILDKNSHIWLRGFINSRGGSEDESMKIGRFLRSNNASVSVEKRAFCYGSCVFILISGVERIVNSGMVAVSLPYSHGEDSLCR